MDENELDGMNLTDKVGTAFKGISNAIHHVSEQIHQITAAKTYEQ